jgi:hypothetical protein
MTWAPACAADSAAALPDVPAPTTTTSVVTVSFISLDGIGGGGTSKDFSLHILYSQLYQDYGYEAGFVEIYYKGRTISKKKC